MVAQHLAVSYEAVTSYNDVCEVTHWPSLSILRPQVLLFIFTTFNFKIVSHFHFSFSFWFLDVATLGLRQKDLEENLDLLHPLKSTPCIIRPDN